MNQKGRITAPLILVHGSTIILLHHLYLGLGQEPAQALMRLESSAMIEPLWVRRRNRAY